MTEEVGGASPWHSRGKPGERTLTLTTLAGEELPVEVDPGGHTSLRSLENAVLARLPHLGNASTLGCELQFVHMNTLQVLADPIQSRESLTHKLLTENQKLSCSKHLVSQVSQRPESKTKEKAGKRHAHFSPHT